MATPLRTEQDWARQHPVPESTEEDMLLSLWNYPVAKSDLAPEHRAALDRFLREALGGAKLGGGAVPSKTEIYLTGHASNTGDDAANEMLSRQRAENVARYLLSRGVTRQQMRVDWAGANDPVDRGNSGLAAARNRRVDVLKFTPSEPERRPPVDIIELPPPPPGRAPTFKLPPPQMSTATIEDTVTVDFPRRATPWYIISGKIDIILKLETTDGGEGFAAGIKTSPTGKFGIKADGEIAKHVKSKFSVDVDPDKRSANVKLGAELTDKPFKPEIGVQAKPDFFYLTVLLAETEIAEFEAGGLRFSGTMSMKGTLNFAPGPAALLVASPIIVALLILGLTVYGIDAAEAEQTRVARLWAAREGVAARIAWELAGNDAKAAFDARRHDWHRANTTMEAEFNAGVNEINRLLKTPEKRNVWNREWKKKYAADNTADFQTLFGRVFDNVGGHESEGTLADAVARAVAE
jgi:outer membrane protein OmpA-like peptidoglycan-associated protein